MFDIEKAKQNSSFRELKNSKVCSKFIEYNGKKLLNLGSNDYLGIASDEALRDEFLASCAKNKWFFGSGASRLVYTSSDVFLELEEWFEKKFASKKALIFNSGYCANLSVISALSSEKTLFLCDKLIHASMIDALKLGKANFKRYPHSDYEALKNLIEQNQDKFEKIIILSEAIFSMDGDSCDLVKLVELKKEYKNLFLYIDEAHSFFARNEFGNAHFLGVYKDIDFLLITLSKGVGSNGAVLLSSSDFKDIFINSARSLIYSTAIPSINIAWSLFVLTKDFSEKRANLEKNIHFLEASSHIFPFVVGSNERALFFSKKLFDVGFFAPAIRPPTVLPNASRLRLSLRGDILSGELEKLKEILDEIRDC
ncbi:aminotransferase class I/II-fold pyridoxal phosphate-dependent enzyme [Campylobacter geochelonis]|uniref:8-amino-7-oxononanoate synthase n=1 Tax=Campylobacter geochelonis TaxID=1780362 RepID=A0A128EK68_9BACT|nr:aminotransferase class I/II-fold pyridoxal phosphate-dependent enzyme [Campylobacter geochelonis]QKF71598.1 8-amino-7-oxononanoate synthase [Campylobacter geochelonis]CZE48663.1 8-amino-7-oxononanoate synthase [Campylobacter geochelonis]CZE48738.1 8-amino-7-oxononanoate synthase [Campylobacter geochelonis]CZE51259.1 8-amino-7-oxononanoate synthase [Campylobacter geochelonis]